MRPVCGQQDGPTWILDGVKVRVDSHVEESRHEAREVAQHALLQHRVPTDTFLAQISEWLMDEHSHYLI